MSRNYGLGSRDMDGAVKILLMREVYKKNYSFESNSSMSIRFSKFTKFLKSKGINRLEHIEREHLITYGMQVAFKVDLGEVTPAYGQNLVSTVNSILNKLRYKHWETVSPTNDCGIPKRNLKRVRPTISNEDAECAIKELSSKLYAVSLAAELALTFGFRIKEASLLDVKGSYKQVLKSGTFQIVKGTKGGRKRWPSEINSDQMELLERAAGFQEGKRSIMPNNDSWKSWITGGLKQGRKILHKHNIKGYHEFRAHFAAKHYKNITGWDAPVNGGVILDKHLDMEARLAVAKVLGHNRPEIAAAYIGGRR